MLFFFSILACTRDKDNTESMDSDFTEDTVTPSEPTWENSAHPEETGIPPTLESM